MNTLPVATRPPKQARSREAWERVLEAGHALLEEGGTDALTITEVCRRSGISAPSLYARVDGRAGLFAAVYELGMQRVRASEEEVFAGLPVEGSSLAEQSARAAAAIAEVFRRHALFLRPVIAFAGGDAALLTRGAAESRRLLLRVVAAIDVEPVVGEEIARTLYAECVVRTLYGLDFLAGAPEPEDVFRARLARAAAARATSTP